VLYYIRQNLGFGKVNLCKDTYYRYIISKKENLEYILNIFNQGNIRQLKVFKRFENWVKYYSLYYCNSDIKVIPQNNKISLFDP